MKVEKINKNKIFINDTRVQFDEASEIKNIIEIDVFLYIMVIFPNGHPEQNSNVWKLDDNGNVVWKIKIFGTDVLGARPFVKMEYAGNKLKVDNWQGVDFYVNLTNGDLEPIKGGRPWQ
ncbi:MAG: hypothetical protein HQK52_21795 [Oligoflexia bacterium]|nr:hypothetical protein [Oligoflexia bacterium]